jgi:trans-aconitate methyltransferase
MTFSPDFYNTAWPKWDSMKVYGPTARHTRRFIFSLLKGLSFDSVLDAGCGSGVLLTEFLTKYPHLKVSGSEYSAEGLEFARERLKDAEFRELDLAKESWGEKFDVVTCIDVLEHIPDDHAALQNLLEMTGKYMILSVPLGPLIKVEEERMGHVHGYSRRELEAKIREAGFEIVKAVQWGFPFYNIHRRIANSMPEGTTMGEYSAHKKLLSNFLYALFYLNLPFSGERYYVLCRPAK